MSKEDEEKMIKLVIQLKKQQSHTLGELIILSEFGYLVS